MDCEIDIDSIPALEEQIRKHEEILIKLKRTRNSLLNVSKFPPEVLGDIFRQNVIRKGDFGGLDKRSHNFLLVCHHWFEVASRTPELWSFWGNTPRDWARWYHCPEPAPLDLVLGGHGHGDDYCYDELYDVLKDRATEDSIRLVHLQAGDSMLINSILHPLAVNGKEIRSNSLESLVLWNRDDVGPVDVSNFFAHYRFPKLQRLDLTNCKISSWDHLTSRTSVLTTLKLDFTHPSRTPTPTPTTSQLLSILSSNPALRKVALLRRAIPNDGGGESSFRVQLRHLEELRLGGDLRGVLKLLDRLDHPRNMVLLSLAFHGCNVVDISRIIGPHLQDHLQCCDRSQNGLDLFISSGNPAYREPHITFHAGDAGEINFSAPSRAEVNTSIEITILLNGEPHRDVLERAALDLISHTPREEVVRLRIHNDPTDMVDTYTKFPNLRVLSFDRMPLSAAFPNQNLIEEGKFFPSLERVLLEEMVVDGADWSPLVTFLAHRASSGNRLDTLLIVRSPHMCPEVMEGIKGMVRELKIQGQRRWEPFQQKCCT